MPNERKYATTTEAEIRARVLNGQKTPQIARELNVSLSRLRAAVSILGIKASKKAPVVRIKREKWHKPNEWVARLEQGESLEKIAKSCGHAYRTLYHYMKANGYPTSRLSAMQAKLKAEQPGQHQQAA